MATAALVPLMLFGALDRITWGGYFYSYIKHFKFNVVDGHATHFGSEPADWYVKKIFARLPIGTPLLFGAMLLAGRVTWSFALAAAGFLVAISSQGHKEERFMIIFWPMLLVGAGAAAGSWLTREDGQSSSPSAIAERTWRRLVSPLKTVVVLLGAVFVLWEGSRHMGNHEFGLKRARFEGETLIGSDPNATGMLVDWSPYTGAYLWFNRTLPFVKYEHPLLANRLFSHVMTTKGSSDEREAIAAGFVRLYVQDSIVVSRRDPANIPP